ncbi:MAG: hypothetical protein OCC46_10690 [Pseudodesulfovibrio sp.]
MSKLIQNRILVIVILCILSFLSTWFGGWCVATISDSTYSAMLTASKYDARIGTLNAIDLGYKNSRADKSVLLNNGVAIRNIIFDFPTDSNYSPENKKNISKAIKNAIGQVESTKQTAKTTFITILGILFFQFLVFWIAILHSIITGELLSANSMRRQLRTTFKKLPKAMEHMASQVSTNSSSILMTIGIGGTFYGLIYGLVNSTSIESIGFNTSSLFLGLKISFFSTLAGIVLSLVSRIVQQAFTGESATLESIAEHISNLEKNIEMTVHRSVAATVSTHYNKSFRLINRCNSELKGCATHLHETKTSLNGFVAQMKRATKRLDETTKSSKRHLKDVDRLSESFLGALGKLKDFEGSADDLKTTLEELTKNQVAYKDQVAELVGFIKDHQTSGLDGYAEALGKVEEKISNMVKLAEQKFGGN